MNEFERLEAALSHPSTPALSPADTLNALRTMGQHELADQLAHNLLFPEEAE